MAAIRTLTIALILAGTAWTSLFSQENADCLHRKVVVLATDDKGNPLENLAPASFRAKFRGRPVHIAGVQPLPPRPRVVLLLDSSGSMRDRWAVSVAIARHVVASAPEDVWLALVTSSTKFEDQVSFSREGRIEMLERLGSYLTSAEVAQGQTPLLDAVMKSVALLEPAHPGDAIYAITDGAENSSRQSVEALRRRLIASGVYLSVILVPDFALLSTEERIFSQEFEKLSVETGGWMIMANAARLASQESERSRFAHTIRRTLAVRGVQLAIDLPEPIHKWREWKLEILTDQGKPDKKAQIAYPRFLQPCAEPQHSP